MIKIKKSSLKTTLNKIKKHKACKPGWKKLLTFLNKTEGDSRPLSIKTILESNGVDDAMWALRAVDGKDKEIRLMAADFAESILHIYEEKFPNDDRPRKAIQAARDYAYGLISVEELEAAGKDVEAAWWASDGFAEYSARLAWGATWPEVANGCFHAIGAVKEARAAARAKSDATRATFWFAESKKQKEILLKYL